MIQGICGRTYFDSSASVGLGSLWANKLAERLARLGSTEYALIWKESAMPAGPSIFRLAVSTRHTNGTGCTGSHWRTPTCNDVEKRGNYDKARSPNLAGDMELTAAQWPTPSVSGIDGGGCRPTPGMEARAARRGPGNLIEGIALASWPTPTVADIEGGRKTRSGSRGDEMLLNGLMAAWPTPVAEDGHHGHRGISDARIAKRLAAGRQLSAQEFMVAVIGRTPTGSNAQTGKRGAHRGSPNPNFAAWLMGWPDWLILGAKKAIIGHKSIIRSSSRRKSVELTSGD